MSVRNCFYKEKRGIPLDTGQHCCNIICRTPSVLQNVQTEFSSSIDVRMEHLADEFDRGWFVWVLLFKLHNKAKGPILEGSIRRTDNDSVPRVVSMADLEDFGTLAYQVMTLSATGDAETPAGGSVCMRWMRLEP